MLVARLMIVISTLGVVTAISGTLATDAVEAEVTVHGDAVVHTKSHVAPEDKLSMVLESPPSPPHREPQPRVPVKSHASLVVLQNELDALETVISLQVQKLQTLDKMRTILIQEPEGEANHVETLTGSRRHRTQEASRQELQEAVDRKVDAVVAKIMAKESRTQFDSFFIEKALVPLEDDVIDVQMGKIKPLSTQDLVVVGSRAGSVRLLVSSGQEMLRLTTDLTPLVSVQLDMASDPPLLALLSGGSSPRVRLYALEITLSPRDGGESKRLGLVDSIKTHEIPLAIDTNANSTISAIAIARSARRSVLSVTRTDGTLGFYALNGTLFHEITTHATASLITTHRNMVAITNGTSLVVFPMTRHKDPEFQICHGSLANISSMAHDPVSPEIVYAGTIDGELLTFLLVNTAESSRSCRLVHRVIVTRAQPLQIAAMKGYVAATSSVDLVVFNVTRTEGSIKLAPACSVRTVPEHVGVINGRIAIAENGHSTVVSVFTMNDAGVPTLLVLQSLLADNESFNGDLGLWRGATTMGMILIVVFTAQYFLRRHKDTEHVDNHGDSNKWRELLEKHGRESSVGQAFDGSRNDRYRGDPSMYNATADTYVSSTNRQKHGNGKRSTQEDELRRKIEEARRETLECSFDDVDDDE